VLDFLKNFRYTIRIESERQKIMKDKKKTYKIETEDRYNQFREYDLEAESLEAATATAEKRVNLPNGAFVTSVKETVPVGSQGTRVLTYEESMER